MLLQWAYTFMGPLLEGTDLWKWYFIFPAGPLEKQLDSNSTSSRMAFSPPAFEKGYQHFADGVSARSQFMSTRAISYFLPACINGMKAETSCAGLAISCAGFAKSGLQSKKDVIVNARQSTDGH